MIVSVTISLDGFIAPHSAPDDLDALRRGESTPNLERWMEQWSRLQASVFPQCFFIESHHLGSGGEEGRDNEILEATFNRTSVSIMDERMFDGGEIGWNEDAPFHTPVYVVTHERRGRGTGPEGPRSISSTTASKQYSTKLATPPARATSASPAAPTPSSSTSTPDSSTSSRSPSLPSSSATAYDCSRTSTPTPSPSN